MSDYFHDAMFIHLRAQVESLVSEREGMIAANQQRIHLGHSLAYDEAAFQRNANQLCCVLPDPHQFG